MILTFAIGRVIFEIQFMKSLSESPNPQQRLLAYFGSKFKEQTGFNYPCQFGKDGKLMKTLFESQGQNENLVMDCIDIFFEMSEQDDFIKKNMGIGMLSSKFPSILIKLSEEAKMRKQHES